MDYISYLPLEVKEITEYKELNKAANPTITGLKTDMTSVSNNHYMSLLDEHGCDRMEKIMEIKNKEGLSVSDRRAVIISKANNTLPYTFYSLKIKIKSILGNEAFDMKIDYSTYHLRIRVFTINKDKMNYIKENITAMMPCNINYEVIVYYNNYKFFKSYKYKELKGMTYKYMREHYFGG